MTPIRQTRDLRRGRLSIPGAQYFVTWCTARRAPVLLKADAVDAALFGLREITTAGDGLILAATVMPDHVHMVLQLGDRLSLDRVVAKVKSSVRRVLPACAWQPNYFEHRLRDAEDVEAYAWYVFMNPYAAGLVGVDDIWPGWWNEPAVPWQFLSLARSGPRPLPEWLPQVNERSRRLVTGEP